MYSTTSPSGPRINLASSGGVIAKPTTRPGYGRSSPCGLKMVLVNCSHADAGLMPV
jgi:hypothetical protein